jgi:hypothetical protein
LVPIEFDPEPSGSRAVMRSMNKPTSSLVRFAPITAPTRTRRRIPARMLRATFLSIAASFAIVACASAPTSTSDATLPTIAPTSATDPASPAPPTFEELYATYFAKGTPGHCATSGCHDDPGHNVWLCSSAETCYQGMIDVGLVDLTDPTHSEIANPKLSPLTWVNAAGGTMPLDAQGDNEAGRAAIEAWVAAGATNDATNDQ